MCINVAVSDFYLSDRVPDAFFYKKCFQLKMSVVKYGLVKNPLHVSESDVLT